VQLVSPTTKEDRSPGRKLEWLRIAAQRKRLTAAASLAVTAAGLVALLILPRLYTATTLIMPPQAGSSTAPALLNQMSALGAMASGSGGWESRIPTTSRSPF
jgi:uncharacterized protein involved in exopolysaccharide biosynthesis